MLRYGIYYGYWQHDYTADFECYIKKYARLGFEVLEIDPLIITSMPQNKIKELKKCADYYAVYLTFGVGFPPELDMARNDEQIQKAAVKSAINIINTISSIGGKELPGIIHTAWNPVIENDLIDDKKSYIERSLKNMKEVAKALEGNGIIYSIETVNRYEHYMLNTIDETISFIDQLGSPNVKILADVFHLNIEEADMVGAIKKAGKYIGYVHLGENNRSLPGTARMDWDGIAKALKNINYKGCIVMEPFVVTGGLIGRDLRIWHNLVNDTSEASLDQYAVKAMEFVRSKFKW